VTFLGFDNMTSSRLCRLMRSGARAEELAENAGFPLHIPKEVPITLLPIGEELGLLGEEIDPKGVYLK